MKQLFALLIVSLILPLSACSVKHKISKECIYDTIDPPALPEMRIESDIPQGALLTLSENEGRCAVFTHEDYSITQEIFPAANWEDAFVHVSGRTADSLQTILAGTFPQEEYRLSWSVAGENGTELCQSAVFFDGSYFYAVSVQCAESKAKTYQEVFDDFFANVELVWV